MRGRSRAGTTRHLRRLRAGVPLTLAISWGRGCPCLSREPALQPNLLTQSATLHRLGDEHTQAGRLTDALKAFQGALALNPLSAPLRFNIATTLRDLKRFDEALTWYDNAIDVMPEFAMAHHNKATTYLHLGRLQEGFSEYEWRKAAPLWKDDPRYSLERPWRGEPLAGKTLYVFPELFQGDLIQFGRYALLAEQTGARVILGAPIAMHALLSTMSPTITLVPDDGPTPDYDYHAPLMSLPHLFSTTLATVPTWQRYLAPEAARVERWRGLIGDSGLKIGIAWQGSVRATTRSFPLAMALDALGQIPGARLISLQKHAGLDQLSALPPGQVQSLGDEFDPGPDAFVDTAAAMQCCDVFVTADTSVAHLAGALGVPTWVAVPFFADWRWLERRADCPWYPSVTIFRQRSRGDWGPVFAEMGKRLRKIARRS